MKTQDQTDFMILQEKVHFVIWHFNQPDGTDKDNLFKMSFSKSK